MQCDQVRGSGQPVRSRGVELIYAPTRVPFVLPLVYQDGSRGVRQRAHGHNAPVAHRGGQRLEQRDAVARCVHSTNGAATWLGVAVAAATESDRVNQWQQPHRHATAAGCGRKIRGVCRRFVGASQQSQRRRIVRPDLHLERDSMLPELRVLPCRSRTVTFESWHTQHFPGQVKGLRTCVARFSTTTPTAPVCRGFANT